MEYRVFYDIQQAGYRSWWILLAGILFALVGAATFFGRRKRPRGNNQPYDFKSVLENKVLPVFIMVFGLMWVGAWKLNYSYYAELRDAARDGRYEVVEGRVKEFVSMPSGGHGDESFVVGGRRFSYSEYDLTKGFNQTQAEGGPIREGLQVRIAYVDGKIIKLEIEQ